MQIASVGAGIYEGIVLAAIVNALASRAQSVGGAHATLPADHRQRANPASPPASAEAQYTLAFGGI
jgi:hypothetical protein